MKNQSNMAKYEEKSRSTCLKAIFLKDILLKIPKTQILGTRFITNSLFVYLSRRSQNTFQQYTV